MAVYPPPNATLPNFNPAVFPDSFVATATSGSTEYQEYLATLSELNATLNAMITKLAFIGTQPFQQRQPAASTTYTNGGTISNITSKVYTVTTAGFATLTLASYQQAIGSTLTTPTTYFNLRLQGPTKPINYEIVPWGNRTTTSFAFGDLLQYAAVLYNIQVVSGNTAGATATMVNTATTLANSNNTYLINIK